MNNTPHYTFLTALDKLQHCWGFWTSGPQKQHRQTFGCPLWNHCIPVIFSEPLDALKMPSEAIHGLYISEIPVQTDPKGVVYSMFTCIQPRRWEAKWRLCHAEGATQSTSWVITPSDNMSDIRDRFLCLISETKHCTNPLHMAMIRPILEIIQESVKGKQYKVFLDEGIKASSKYQNSFQLHRNKPTVRPYG